MISGNVVLSKVLQFYSGSAGDVLSLCRVSRTFNDLIRADTLVWRFLILNRWPMVNPAMKKLDLAYYKRRHLLSGPPDDL